MRASRTSFKSKAEPLITLSTSAVAVCCSRASFSSRASCAALVSLLAARELRPRAAFGASRRFNVLGRCVFAALPPVLSRRLIQAPDAQGPGIVANYTFILEGGYRCPL